MATLVLTVAGGAIGGPLGAAIGAALGRTVDREVLFPAARREGPRLTDLAVQTSSYGSAIPQLFGTMRVAGTVIWATDLIEHRSTSGGGKGAPKTTRYSYSASFAVLLSARPIVAVRRIWADGKLLRGAAGDFKANTGFRLKTGGEDQLVDPLIASAEGMAVSPAHRGCAYAVFEDLDLTDFGNRIPSLTFEVVADAEALDIATIAEAVSEGIVSGATGTMLSGYSAYGDDRRAIVTQLAQASGCRIEQHPDGLRLAADDAGDAVVIADDGAMPGDGAGNRASRSRSVADRASVPSTLIIAHYDPARDYQAGVQRAVAGSGGEERKLSLPAAIDAQSAKQLAEQGLARLRARRERRRVTLDWSGAAVVPGAAVAIAGEAGRWRITSWSLEHMALTLELERGAANVPNVAASAGRVLAALDRTIGRTLITAFELPPLDETAWAVPRIGIATCGEGDGWRQAALLLSTDDGASWQELGGSAPPAVMGLISRPAGAASPLIEDRVNTIEVTLFAPGMALGDADAGVLDGGANLAMVGDELLQFSVAEQIGPARWRLSGLRRGLRGTERHVGAMAIGDRFTLIEREALRVVEVPVGRMGAGVRVRAVGLEDPVDGTEAVVALDGRSVLAPAPVHLAINREAGSEVLRWVRRSRIGWNWIDGAETPLGEAAERYLVQADGALAVELTEARFVPGVAAWRPAMVRQMGDRGLSPAAISSDDEEG